jgi:hypothetical protein
MRGGLVIIIKMFISLTPIFKNQNVYIDRNINILEAWWAQNNLNEMLSNVLFLLILQTIISFSPWMFIYEKKNLNILNCKNEVFQFRQKTKKTHIQNKKKIDLNKILFAFYLKRNQILLWNWI